MNVKDFVNAGFRFSYCMDCVCSQIPTVQDVLYALHMTDSHEHYELMLSNHEPYVANVHLVAAAAGLEVLVMRPRNEQEMRKIIGQAIVDLCPDEARCVKYQNHNHAYVMAMKEAGLEIPAHNHATCPHCIERSRRDNAPTGDFDCEEGADDFLD